MKNMLRIDTKILLMLLLSSIITLSINIQLTMSSEPPDTEWSQTYGGTDNDIARSVVQTNDGGYALIGWTSSLGAGNEDFWLIKTNSTGHEEWNQTYGGANQERGLSAVQTSDGGYMIVGFTKSYGAGGLDFWLIKTDVNGTMEWNRTYGGASDDAARSVVQTNDGGYAILGFTFSYSVGLDDFWLIKTNSTGHEEWNQTYGGSRNDDGQSVVQTSDGGFALGGGTCSFGAGNFDFWLVKTNASGHKQWDKTYGGGSVDQCINMVQTSEGGYALAGYTESFGAGGRDFWLVKTYANGTSEWNQTYGGAQQDSATDIVQTFDGGYAIIGWTTSFGAGNKDFWLIKAGSTGNMRWNLPLGGTNEDMGWSINQTTDGGYVIAGRTLSFGAGNHDFWLIKLVSTPIDATIDICPNTLNLKSRSSWIAAYIELPEGYDINDVDVSTIMLNYTIPAELDLTEIGDFDSDGIPDLMVKFNRAEVINYIKNAIPLELKFAEVTLTVTGSLVDGPSFTGADLIRAIWKSPKMH